MTAPKYPEIAVELTGDSDNALHIIGKVSKAMRRAQLPKDQIEQFAKEAMSGDYNNVLLTAMRWVDCS